MKNGKANKPLYIILSIIIACCLWLYVVNVENVDQDKTLSNVPITFVGEEVLASSNLMVTEGRNAVVSLQIQGKRGVLAKINRTNVTIQVDVSKIAAAGEYSQAYSIVWPGNVSPGEVATLDRSPFYVNLAVSKRVTRTVEVKGEFVGSVAEGFQKGEFVFNPTTVEISGEEALVNQVDHVLVTLNREEALSETFRGDMPVTLIGFTGDSLAGLNVQCEPATVGVTLPVVMIKEVPLKVDFTPGGGATAENITYKIEPETIVISGSESDLAAYDDITLGVIDLSKVLSSETYPYTISLAPELVNVSGITEATVTVQINGLVTKTVETASVEVVNVAPGVTAVPVTQSIQIQVRGTQQAVDLVLAQHLRVVADLKDLSLPKGQNIVSAKVYLDGGSGSGVVGEYKIAIDIS